MGGLFSGSSTTKSSSTTDTGPSQFQKPYLTDAFNAAQNNFDAQSGTPYYSGELYAGMSDAGKSDLSAMKDYASGTGLNTANQLSSIGTNLAGYAGKAGSTIDDYLAAANGDATKSNIAAANQYADNPYLTAQIDAANRDVGRTLNEQTLPGIDRQASGTGNINSSRSGVAQGIAMRGAADQEADTAAQMRGQAYSQGLTLAQQDRAQKLQALGTAATDYQGLAGTGINALQAGANAGYGAFSQLNSADQTEQADRQGQDAAKFQTWQGNDTRQSDLLNRYYGIVGSNQWGQYGTTSGTQTQTSSPSLMSMAMGGLSLAGGLGWKPFA